MIDVSVIIPTYNRANSLQRTLDSLQMQTLPPDRFEVIVVDDGSSDHTAEVCRKPYSYLVQYIRQGNAGAASARNRGALESQGEILIFLDDDITINEQYVEALVNEHRIYQRVIVMGDWYYGLENLGTFFSRYYPQLLQPNLSKNDSVCVNFTECLTYNLSVKRKCFFDIGMMQDVAGDGPTLWGDVDFGYRAKQLNFRFRRCKEAICYHYDYSMKNLPTYSNRVYRSAKIAVLLFNKHPEVVPYIPAFEDKAPISIKDDAPVLIGRKLLRTIIAWDPILKSMELLVRLFELICPNPVLLQRLYRWIVSSYIYRGFRDGLRETSK